jgi:hypothetical protein
MHAHDAVVPRQKDEQHKEGLRGYANVGMCESAGTLCAASPAASSTGREQP